ncbi:MAG: hypothetical protein ACSW8A_02710, partial [Lachnospiraceae bacterium]
MRNIFRSTAGKTFLFIVIIMSLCVGAASAGLACLMVWDEAYDRSEDELIEQYLSEEIGLAGENVLRSTMENYEISVRIPLVLLDSNGKVIAKSEAMDTIESHNSYDDYQLFDMWYWGYPLDVEYSETN